MSLIYNKEVYCSIILCVDRLQQKRYNPEKDNKNCSNSDLKFRFTYHYFQRSTSSTILLKIQRKVSTLVKIVFFIHFKNVFTRKTIIYIYYVHDRAFEMIISLTCSKIIRNIWDSWLEFRDQIFFLLKFVSVKPKEKFFCLILFVWILR